MDVGDLVGGRFAVESLAGEGGMGRVFRATDRLSGSVVAIKVLRDASASASDTERFEREAGVLARLAHPAIVRYVSHGTTPLRERYLVMEWLAGETLEDRLARGISIADTMAIVRQVAAALGSAHRAGVIHRDIKPTNVFLVAGETLDLRVIDFGIARFGQRSAQTHAGAPIGTPTYMSPEQVRGELDITPATDIFALGCVLFECLTGQPPFVGHHPVEVMSKILIEEAPLVRTQNEAVGSDVEALLARMLAKEASARPRDGDALVAELEALERLKTGEGAVLQRRRSERPELTMGEQRWLSVALIDAPVAQPDAATIPGDLVGGELARAVALLGCHAMNLANGAVLVVPAQMGAPADQAERAARAALTAVSGQAGTKVAIVTGRGRVAGRLPVGEVVTRAVQLLASEANGRIRIDTTTANLLASRFMIGGASGARVLEGERAANANVASEGPLVGRDTELALLTATYAECVDEPRAHAVVLTGAAGIGKSRLTDELLRRVSPSRVWHARGEPMSAGSSLGLLAQLVRNGLDVVGLEPSAVRERLEAYVDERLPASEAGRVVEFLAELLHAASPDVSVQVQVARRNPLLMGDQLRQAWEELVIAECTVGPLVLVLEDMQWGDLPTVSFLESVLRRAAELPLLVVALGRPELDDAFPDLWTGVDAKRVRLNALSARAGQKLARALLGPNTTEDMVAKVVERGQGIPFLLEELGRAIADGRGDALPESVLAMAHARLESLDGAARRVLRAASVFGHEFWRGGVSALVGGERRTGTLEWLPLLLGRDLIVRRTPSRFADDEEYAFRQPLLGDAAYAALTEEDRVLGHRLAAEWLLRVGEIDPLVLAEHFARGGQPAIAAMHYARAAQQSLEGHDFAAAISHARAGLIGANGGDLHLILAEALRWQGSFAEAHPHAMRAVEILPRGSALQLRACEERALVAVRLGQFDDVADWAHAALDVPIDANDGEIVSAYVRYLSATSRATFQAGSYELAEALLDRVRIHVAAADPAARADAHRLEGARARHNGDLAGDARAYGRAVDAFHEAGDARNACNAEVSLGFAFLELGQLERATGILEHARATAERLRLPTVATRARQNLGLVLGWRGDLATARALLARVATESREQANVRFEGWTRIYLANIAHAAGDFENAIAEAVAAETLLASTPPALAGASAAHARALVAAGRVDEATPFAARALQILSELGTVEEFEPLVRLAWVEVLVAAARPREAAIAATEAERRIRERAAAIADEAWRASFLDAVPENVATLALADTIRRA